MHVSPFSKQGPPFSNFVFLPFSLWYKADGATHFMFLVLIHALGTTPTGPELPRSSCRHDDDGDDSVLVAVKTVKSVKSCLVEPLNLQKKAAKSVKPVKSFLADAVVGLFVAPRLFHSIVLLYSSILVFWHDGEL